VGTARLDRLLSSCVIKNIVPRIPSARRRGIFLAKRRFVAAIGSSGARRCRSTGSTSMRRTGGTRRSGTASQDTRRTHPVPGDGAFKSFVRIALESIRKASHSRKSTGYFDRLVGQLFECGVQRHQTLLALDAKVARPCRLKSTRNCQFCSDPHQNFMQRRPLW
jgi:hypothetical protein